MRKAKRTIVETTNPALGIKATGRKMRKEIQDRLLKSKSIDRNFEVGSIIVLSIPRIDRHIVDRPHFLEKTKGKYRLGCASGILDVTYGANELNLVEADFPELDNRKLSLREAAKTQSVVDVVSGRQTRYMCKTRNALIVDVAVEKSSTEM